MVERSHEFRSVLRTRSASKQPEDGLLVEGRCVTLKVKDDARRFITGYRRTSSSSAPKTPHRSNDGGMRLTVSGGNGSDGRIVSRIH